MGSTTVRYARIGGRWSERWQGGEDCRRGLTLFYKGPVEVETTLELSEEVDGVLVGLQAGMIPSGSQVYLVVPRAGFQGEL